VPIAYFDGEMWLVWGSILRKSLIDTIELLQAETYHLRL